jgi:peptidoglycan L-alanyl-D-glutamate endopeptidase CwlK
MPLGRTSLARLATCHELLQTLVRRTSARLDAAGLDCSVLCGHRTQAEQDAAVASGASKLRWPRSKHNQTPSLAVDLAPYVKGRVSWDWPDYHRMSMHVRAVWAEMVEEGLTTGWALTWGGDWTTFKDGPHWELQDD